MIFRKRNRRAKVVLQTLDGKRTVLRSGDELQITLNLDNFKSEYPSAFTVAGNLAVTTKVKVAEVWT